MSLKNVFFVTAFLLVMFSCADNTSESVENINTSNLNQELKYQVDSISLDIDRTQLTIYSKYFFDPTNSTLYGYNRTDHSIDIFSIDDLKVKKKITLESEGPNMVDKISALNVHNQLIHTVSRNYITVIDMDGNVQKSTLINSLNEKFYSENQVYVANPSEFKYVEGEGYYLKITNYKDSQSRFPEKHYRNGRIVSLLSTNNKINDQFEIKYPVEFQENYYGFNRLTQFIHSSDGNSIYYNFSSLPFIFKYDKKERTTSKYIYDDSVLPVLKKKTLNWGDADNPDKLMKHFSSNSNFGTLYESDSYIFHLYTTGLKEGVVDFKNLRKYKKQVLLVFDKNLNLLNTINLKKSGVYNSGFTKGDKIYFPKITKNENKASFIIYDFSS